MTFSYQDSQCMSLAMKLSMKGRSAVGANPMVGCVIARDGKVIAQDYHREYGKAHAEVNALDQIKLQAKGATMYVTLEPCSHHGKTPPCAISIIKSGVKKVIVAMLDPNPLNCGRGVNLIQNAGIEVDVGLLENEARELNRGFVKRMLTGLPFVTSKIAMSLDGKTAMSSGESKWITSEQSRKDVQKLRCNNQAIMTGSGTVIKDNPSLTFRLNDSEISPLRVVIDSGNKISNQELNIFSSNASTLILNSNNSSVLSNGKIDLKAVLVKLGEMGINNLLVEAGSGLNGAMLEGGLIDEYIIYTAPIILGSDARSMFQVSLTKITEKINLDIVEIRNIGDDIKIKAIPR